MFYYFLYLFYRSDSVTVLFDSYDDSFFLY